MHACDFTGVLCCFCAVFVPFSLVLYCFHCCFQVVRPRWSGVKLMDFVLKPRSFVLKLRNFVLTTRNFVFKMMNAARDAERQVSRTRGVYVLQRCCLLCIYMPAIDRPLSDCIYMPAIDRPLSDCRYWQDVRCAAYGRPWRAS